MKLNSRAEAMEGLKKGKNESETASRSGRGIEGSAGRGREHLVSSVLDMSVR